MKGENMKREVNMRTPIESTKGKSSGSKKAPTTIIDPQKEKESRIITDPLGSWTGVPEDDYFDKPIQDVDDL